MDVLSAPWGTGMPEIKHCWLGWMLCVLSLMVSGAGLAQRNLVVSPTSQRHALVIGNDSYLRVNKLDNARADARAMARALERAGFTVILKLDAGRAEMLETVRSFKARLTGGSEAVFFFAGHGVQLGAANYLLPVDIMADNEEQVKDDGLPLQRVLDDLADQKVRFSLAIIDACRDNPFPRTAGRSIGATRGLAPTTAATGQMVIYSAGAGQKALDRLNEADRNPNGLFTRLFLQEMQQPLPVDRMLRGVRDKVVAIARSVGHEQVPALYDQTIGEFYFQAPTGSVQAGNVAPPPAPVSPSPASPPLPTDPRAEERALWDTVKDSGNATELRVYLEQYPKGIFAGVAHARLKSLNAAKPPAQVTNTAPALPAPNLSGVWREIYPNAGTLMEMTQEGTAFRYVARPTVEGRMIQVSGQGTLRGRTVESTHQSTAPSRGRCSGVLSADGRQVTSTCTDSVFGQFETLSVRQ